MYNCIQCNKLEDLYFKCNKCKKQFCRRCIGADKHKCQSNMIKSYSLDMFCNYNECIKVDHLILCKNCKKYYCSEHLKHECKSKFLSECTIQ